MLDDGREFVMCNRSDGLGFDMLKKANIPMLILSTETSSVVEARAAKIKIPVIYGSTDKAKDLTCFCEQNDINMNSVAYIGNDINDLDAMNLVKYKICPADADISIKQISDIVLKTKGGYGIVREVYRIIMTS